jgi:hypothetical protein
MNTEVVLPVHRTFFQIYNCGDAARQQLEKDFKAGHIPDLKYASILKSINSPNVSIWSYTSIRSDSKVVGIYRDTSLLTKHININALLTLCCDVTECVLAINGLKLADIYDSHWFTYLSETLFTYILPLYLSDKYTYTLKKQTNMEHEYTVYNTNVITVLSTVEADVKREYPDYIDAALLNSAEESFTNHAIQGVCLLKKEGSQQVVCVKINTAQSPYGYIETMSTLFHELIHTMANLISHYEGHIVVTRYDILFRQLATSYVYWIMSSMSKELWQVDDKVIPEPAAPVTEQLILPIDAR